MLCVWWSPALAMFRESCAGCVLTCDLNLISDRRMLGAVFGAETAFVWRRADGPPSPTKYPCLEGSLHSSQRKQARMLLMCKTILHSSMEIWEIPSFFFFTSRYRKLEMIRNWNTECRKTLLSLPVWTTCELRRRQCSFRTPHLNFLEPLITFVTTRVWGAPRVPTSNLLTSHSVTELSLPTRGEKTVRPSCRPKWPIKSSYFLICCLTAHFVSSVLFETLGLELVCSEIALLQHLITHTAWLLSPARNTASLKLSSYEIIWREFHWWNYLHERYSKHCRWGKHCKLGKVVSSNWNM